MIRNVNVMYTYGYQVQNKMINFYVYHYDQEMFVVLHWT